MKIKSCILLFISVFLFCGNIYALEDTLLPKPQLIEYGKGEFKIDRLGINATVLEDELKDIIAPLGAVIDNKAAKVINIHIVDSLSGVTLNGDEAYRLVVSSKSVEIKASTPKGAYWALQTLRQLIQKGGKGYYIKECSITDWPAFRVRGFMQDVGRSYISLAELKREIEVLSRFKVNVFHFHLTENQSWRLESRVFPALNDSVNTTRMPGKYYTLDEAKELVGYCKKHNVMLIPEIDMPGHSEAFKRTFHCDMQSREGMDILKALIKEVCQSFDVPYLHIGTDEVAFTNMDFVPEMVAYVRSLGKRVISWNPGWNYKPGEIDMAQLWSYRGKAQQGIAAIDSRFHYLNHFDTFADIVALYNSRICNVQHGSDDIAGVIAAVWNDRLVLPEENIILENNFYPNMLAMAERAWIGGGSEYFDKSGTVIPIDKDAEEYKGFADFERRMLWHKRNTFSGFPFCYVKQTNVEWNISDAFPNDGDLSISFPPEKEIKDTYIYKEKSYVWNKAIGAGIYLRHVWGKLVPSFYKEPQQNHTAYAYTWVYSPKEQDAGALIEFQNYSRSEKDLPPRQGTWDYKESRIWINDKEVMPPLWSASHTTPSNETALGNENCVARKPTMVHLDKGWNKIFIKLPIGKFSIPEVRLVKWMFTFVLVNPDGHDALDALDALDGIVYSPKRIK